MPFSFWNAFNFAWELSKLARSSFSCSSNHCAACLEGSLRSLRVVSMYPCANALAMVAAVAGSPAVYWICITLLWDASTLSLASRPEAIQSSTVPGARDWAKAACALGFSASLRFSTTRRATRWLLMMSICVWMKPVRSRAEASGPVSDCSSRLSTRSATLAS